MLDTGYWMLDNWMLPTPYSLLILTSLFSPLTSLFSPLSSHFSPLILLTSSALTSSALFPQVFRI